MIDLDKIIPNGQFVGIITTVEMKYSSIDEDIDFHYLQINWSIDTSLDDECEENFYDIKQDIEIDVTDDNAIDLSIGKNRELTQLRKLFNQIQSNWEPSLLIGSVANISISEEDIAGLFIKKVSVVSKA